jgi:hypothetical protein
MVDATPPVLMPRRVTRVTPGRSVVRLRPGTSGTRSWKSSTRCCSSSWPPTTVTEAGMSLIASLRFWAVTTSSSRKPGGLEASSGAAGCAGSLPCADAAFFASSGLGVSWAQAAPAASTPVSARTLVVEARIQPPPRLRNHVC